MSEDQQKRHFDPKTKASLPSQYRITRSEYARYFEKNFLHRAWCYAASFLPGKREHFRYIQEWFLHGDTNPVTVVDVRHRLVAAFTRLGTSKPYGFPAIRVVRVRTSLIRGPLREGQRLTGVSSYFDHQPQINRWRTFMPMVAECMCTDLAKCEEIKARIPESDWQALEAGLEQLPQPIKEGLYDIPLSSEHPKQKLHKTERVREKRLLDRNSSADLPARCDLTREEFERYFKKSAATSLLPNGKNHFEFMREWLVFGNTTPAVILDAKSGLVAVFTVLDMSKPCRFPVIRVVREKLNLMLGGARDGQRVAGISLYGADENSRRIGRWTTFNPIVIDCISTDPDACARIKATIPQSDWQALALGLKQIPHPVREGLYDIQLPPELLE